MWQIRPARQEDHDSALTLWSNAGMGRASEEEWRAIIAGPSATLLVAAEGGKLIGTAVTSYDGWRAYVYHVAVDPGARQRGVAKALMAEAEKQLRQRGARRIFALVNENNTAGLALCAAAGYEPEGDLAFVREAGP